MKYYQELTLLPCAEVPAYFIWSKIYQQLHLGFVSQKDETGHVPIGVSFPDYKDKPIKKTASGNEKEEIDSAVTLCALGLKLRLFAMEESILKEFDVKSLLVRLSDYVHITQVRPVPNKLKGYASYCRFHQKNSVEQKARRYAKRHNISYEESLKLFPDREFNKVVPFIQLKSLTNKHPFRLFIRKIIKNQNTESNFGTYGLSDTSTVPEF